MLAKEFLEKIITIDNLINCKIAQIKDLRDGLSYVGSNLSSDKVQSSIDPDKFTNTISKIIDLESEINRDIDRLVDYKKTARELIEKLDSDTQKIILYKRYFEGKTFETISVECGYSWRQTHRIHSKALQRLNEVIESHNTKVI